jgi:6-phosphogluconolactonase
MNLRVFESTEDMIAATARAARSSAPSSIALSGGRTPLPLFEALRGQLDDREMTWVVVDERYVPLDDPQSNAGMMQRTLFANGMPPGHRFLRFRTELGDPVQTAAAFEDEWHALGLTKLDVIVLGVGDDGHTASLFPGTEVLEVEDRVAAAVYVPRLEQWRVTLTLPVIRDAGVRLVMATGASKAAIVREVREGVAHPIARATAGLESWWLVDRSVIA